MNPKEIPYEIVEGAIETIRDETSRDTIQVNPQYIDESSYRAPNGRWYESKTEYENELIDAYRRTLYQAGVPVPSREAIRRVLTTAPDDAARELDKIEQTATPTGPNRHQRRAAAKRNRSR